MYERRVYRQQINDKELVSFQVIAGESDLFIRADRNLKLETEKLIKKYRSEIEDYVSRDHRFLTSLEPYAVRDNPPLIIKDMALAANKASVGPMAAVAGAIAEFVGKDLSKISEEVIIENGGDVYISSKKKRNLAIYAGKSTYTNKLAIQIDTKDMPLNVATSSGTVGHSISFGRADAAIAISKSGSLSDACATKLGNLVTSREDVNKAIETINKIDGVEGLVVIIDEIVGIWGKVKLVNI